MLVHPIHCKDIYDARQKEREDEVCVYRLDVSQGGSKGSELAVSLGRFFAVVLAATALAITG